jgi:hypothetical protein
MSCPTSALPTRFAAERALVVAEATASKPAMQVPDDSALAVGAIVGAILIRALPGKPPSVRNLVADFFPLNEPQHCPTAAFGSPAATLVSVRGAIIGDHGAELLDAVRGAIDLLRARTGRLPLTLEQLRARLNYPPQTREQPQQQTLEQPQQQTLEQQHEAAGMRERDSAQPSTGACAAVGTDGARAAVGKEGACDAVGADCHSVDGFMIFSFKHTFAMPVLRWPDALSATEAEAEAGACPAENATPTHRVTVQQQPQQPQPQQQPQQQLQQPQQQQPQPQPPQQQQPQPQQPPQHLQQHQQRQQESAFLILDLANNRTPPPTAAPPSPTAASQPTPAARTASAESTDATSCSHSTVRSRKRERPAECEQQEEEEQNEEEEEQQQQQEEDGAYAYEQEEEQFPNEGCEQAQQDEEEYAQVLQEYAYAQEQEMEMEQQEEEPQRVLMAHMWLPSKGLADGSWRQPARLDLHSRALRAAASRSCLSPGLENGPRGPGWHGGAPYRSWPVTHSVC